MKEQLIDVAANYDTNDFYSISFMNGSIKLQGNASQSVRKKYEKFGFVFSLTDYGWIEATRHDVTITLTF